MGAEIEGEEEADNLYMACNTPLRRKLVASNKVKKIVSKTNSETLMNELEGICLPKLNVIVE